MKWVAQRVLPAVDLLTLCDEGVSSQVGWILTR